MFQFLGAVLLIIGVTVGLYLLSSAIIGITATNFLIGIFIIASICIAIGKAYSDD